MKWWWKNNKAKKRGIHADAPGFWQAYERDQGSGPVPATRLHELSFVVLDTETSGLDHRKHKLLSIGALRVQNWQIVLRDRFEAMILADQENVADSAAIHEILPGGGHHKRPEREVLIELLTFLRNDIIVGHHIAFDRQMLDQALGAFNGGYSLQNLFLDTGTLAKRVFTSGPYQPEQSWSLDALCDHLEIDVYERHTAGGDAFLTALVFLKLLARLEKRGVNNLRQLMRPHRRRLF